MKKLFLLAVVMCALNTVKAQTFYVELSRDSILVDNSYTVSFIAENLDGVFTPPDLSEFRVMSTMTKSSSQFMQGEMQRRTSYDYVIYADEIGEFYIPEAQFQMDDEVIYTEPLKVSVHANPDGIVQKDEDKRSYFFESDAFEMDIFTPKRSTPDYEPNDKKPKRKVKRI